MKMTRMCVRHRYKEATSWSGHVHRAGHQIMSGLCNVCAERLASGTLSDMEKVCKPTSVSYGGCDGKWKTSYGLLDD